ncbi:MAG: Gfo/Idh/MocA family oxidoreductase [Clostridia bacterium]|nr:Gfo/Idh/MocA family oxidoreductase [Clostridia bacterium]
MRKLRIVQIGMGHDHATVILNSLLKQTDLFEVVALGLDDYDHTFPERVDRYDLPKMSPEEALNLPDLDAAVIESREMDLTGYAQMAADRGLHIHMDKPGAPNLAAFEELVETCREKKLVFHTGYMYRYNTAVQQALADAKNGKLGEIYAVEAQMNCLHKPERYTWLPDYPGGMMFFLGCHLIDLILQFKGLPKEILPLNTGHTYGMAVLKYKDGISFAKTCDTEPGGFCRRQLIVCGTEGTIELEPLEDFSDPKDSTVICTGRRYAEKNLCLEKGWGYHGERDTTAPHSRYDGMMAAFAAYVNGQKENPYTYDYEKTLFKTILECCGGTK